MKIIFFTQDESLHKQLDKIKNYEILFTDSHEEIEDLLDEDNNLLFIDFDYEKRKIAEKVNKVYLKDQSVKRVIVSDSWSLKEIKKHQKSRKSADAYLHKPLDGEIVTAIIQDFHLDSEEVTNSEEIGEGESTQSYEEDFDPEVIATLEEHSSEEDISSDNKELSDDIQDQFDSALLGASDNEQGDQPSTEPMDMDKTVEIKGFQEGEMGNALGLSLGVQDDDQDIQDQDNVIKDDQEEQSEIEEVELPKEQEDVKEFESGPEEELKEFESKQEQEELDEPVAAPSEKEESEEWGELNLDDDQEINEQEIREEKTYVQDSSRNGQSMEEVSMASNDDIKLDAEETTTPDEGSNGFQLSINGESNDSEEVGQDLDNVEELSESDGDLSFAVEEESGGPEMAVSQDSDSGQEEVGGLELGEEQASDFDLEMDSENGGGLSEDSNGGLEFGAQDDAAEVEVESSDINLDSSDDLEIPSTPDEGLEVEISEESSPQDLDKDINVAQELFEKETETPSGGAYSMGPAGGGEDSVRLQATIRHLRQEREGLLKEIKNLNKEKKLVEQENLGLKAELDELKIELSIINKRHNEEIHELKQKYSLTGDKKAILEKKLRDYQKEFDRLNQKVRIDFGQVKQREKELEGQLELVKMDSESQVQSRDTKILELKRKIDSLEFNMENISIREQKSREDKRKLEERLKRIMKTLRGSIKLLEEDLDIEDDLLDSIK